MCKKRVRSERRLSGKGFHQFMQFEFEIIYELSERYPIQKLCSIMDINRSSFYKWEKRLHVPNEKKVKRMENIQLFMNYHNKYPTHGYRWLNAKIRLDLGPYYVR